MFLLPLGALAQSWPAGHPITILMGFPAGSGVDVVARLLQEPMEKSLGTRIVTDYRTNARAGLKMEHIPYKGGPEAIQSVIAGQTCCIFNQVQTVIPHWKAAKVRLLGVTTKNRVQAVAEIPTIAEAGLPGYESYTWFGLFGPKGLDAAIVSKVNTAVKTALETPSVQKRLVEMGNTPRWESPEQFRQTVKADRQKWASVVKEVGATID